MTGSNSLAQTSDATLDLLISLYIGERLSQREIGKRLDVSQRTIGRWLYRYSIPIRKDKGMTGKGNPAWKNGTSKNKSGHVLVWRPGHPRANQNNRVRRAVLVWEEYYNRPFPEGTEPHHDNEIPDDDRPENIIPLTHSEHTREHVLRRQKRR